MLSSSNALIIYSDCTRHCEVWMYVHSMNTRSEHRNKVGK